MKYYLIGIKGTGMSTLAQILFDLGNEVSGFDDAKDYKFTQKGLEERGIKIYYDHDHNIDSDTIVSHSVAVSVDNEEIKRVKEMGLTIKKYNEILGDITKQFDTLAVSGTHGKTTTSSLIRHIIDHVYGCNYFIGAGDGFADKKNKYFVIESDEFNRHFTVFHSKYAVITNIEEEHMECYKDIDDIRNTFEKFANNVKEKIIACGDNEQIRKINYKVPVIYYGFNEDNDVVIKNLDLTSNGSNFDLYIHNEFYGHFDIPLFGKHMILDATAVILICKEQKISKDQMEELLQSFQNAKRRFAVEKIKNAIIVDDYAHHPTEIKVTLEAIKQRYPDKRLVVVFKPNTYSRIVDFTNEFVEAFGIADKVFLTPIDSNREKQKDYPGVSSNIIIEKLENADIINEDTIDKLEGEKDSVICFMSCAYVDHLIEGFKKLF